jgi:hypothetical protein
MPCSHCAAPKTFARGLCQACYYRLRRNGSVERKNVINSGLCAVEGCEKAAFAKNLCQTHYNRADHPMKATWKILRSRYPGQFDPSWESFDRFLADVGSRPTRKHQLRRTNLTKPFSKENVAWFAPVSSGSDRGKWTPEDTASYARAWSLKTKFGISMERYDEMLAAQNGVCAICGGKESHIHKSGKLKELSVDHCHTNGNIRGLLCMNCNQALGRFQDNIEYLRRAIAYLEKS